MARTALEFVIFSSRPPTLEEVAEAVAVGSFDGPFDVGNRLFEPEMILVICSSLLVLEENPHRDPGLEHSATASVSGLHDVLVSDGDSISDSLLVAYDASDLDNKRTIRPAHNTVNEYLQSTHILNGPVSLFAMSEDTSNSSLAKICLRYLLLFNNSGPLDEDVEEKFPLSYYAANLWYEHVTAAGIHHDERITSLLRTFLDTKDHFSFLNSIRISDPDRHYEAHYTLQLADLLSPVYYLCRQGVCRELLKFAIDLGCYVNGNGGLCKFALQAAVVACHLSGHDNVDTLDDLLEAGADVNATLGFWDSINRGYFRRL